MTVNYFQFIPCCQGQQILFFAGDPDLIPDGVYEYLGQCYTVTYIYKTSTEVLDTITIDELIFRADCNADECLCCQCIRVRTRDVLPATSLNVGVTDCSGADLLIPVPGDMTWSEKNCARSWVIDTSIFEVEILGDCIDDECPAETCFFLEDCEGIQEDIYATYASMSAYVDSGAIIKIDGFPDTCWSYREVDTCECAIEVTVLSTWVDCEDCQRCKGYKLTNCEDDTYIKYTTNDLSDYIGKAVEFENCPGCWFVECMEVAPPNDQDLVVDYSFENCEECLSTFWKLTACIGDRDPIFTDNDLTPYVGFILTLDGIDDTCWTLEEVRDLEGNTFETVFVNTYYATCEECIVDILDCQCSTAVNSWPVAMPIQYLDCNGLWQTTDPILPGARTPRLCVVEWSDIGKIASEIEWYGNCTEVQLDDTTEPNTWNCPVVVPRLRSVRPGYDTPGCPADYFEKVSCKFAEALYKDVLADRYGITTNCSSDEFNKWEIKKELLNLAAITNPDYDCPPIAGCYDACAATAGFENCLTGPCHSYSITYEPNASDDVITYTDCTTCEITTIDHTSTDTETVYYICIAPGTPVVTEGFLEQIGECEPNVSPAPCLEYSLLLSPGTPSGSYTYTDCDDVEQTVDYPNQISGTLTVFCAQAGSISTVGIVTELGPCP